MSLERLIEKFCGVADLPVEIPDVRNAIVALGYQDEITFIPENIDPGKLRGVFYQFTKRETVYGDPKLCTLIVYSGNLTVEWQRLVCGKELVHVMDARVEQTRSPAEVDGLVEKLLGPLSTEDFGLADFMAAKDKLALYQALPILFPEAARAAAAAKLAAKEKTIEQIAAWGCLPLPITRVVMSDEWPALQKDLCC